MSEARSLSIRSVTKSYHPGQNAVDDISLEVAAGEFVSFLGPSGSGKTTTLMMVAGFEAPSRGDILIGGRKIDRAPAHQRNIGMVFQNYALFPHMTVAENVAFPLKMRGVGKAQMQARTERALAMVGLASFADRRPSQLSGGQQQRVALSRALVFEPDLVLMDEPLGALDKSLREQMQIEIKRIHRDLGVTMIYVTHDQTEAMTMSDRIAVFNHGRIEQIGRPREIYDRPQTRFVASFVGDSNLIAGRRTAAGLRLEGIGDFAMPPGAAPGAERDVVALVRPETIGLVAAGAGEADLVIEDVITFGESCIVIGAVGDTPLRVRVSSVDLPDGLTGGARVGLRFRPQWFHLLPASAR